MKFGLPDHIITQIQNVLANYDAIDEAVIYGSRAKGNYKNGSDIDLTLIGNGLSHAVLLKVYGDLDDLLLPYSIDLSIFSDIDNPDLCDHIKRVGQIFYKR